MTTLGSTWQNRVHRIACIRNSPGSQRMIFRPPEGIGITSLGQPPTDAGDLQADTHGQTPTHEQGCDSIPCTSRSKEQPDPDRLTSRGNWNCYYRRFAGPENCINLLRVEGWCRFAPCGLRPHDDSPVRRITVHRGDKLGAISNHHGGKLCCAFGADTEDFNPDIFLPSSTEARTDNDHRAHDQGHNGRQPQVASATGFRFELHGVPGRILSDPSPIVASLARLGHGQTSLCQLRSKYPVKVAGSDQVVRRAEMGSQEDIARPRTIGASTAASRLRAKSSQA